jgi:hypothetical protein
MYPLLPPAWRNKNWGRGYVREGELEKGGERVRGESRRIREMRNERRRNRRGEIREIGR